MKKVKGLTEKEEHFCREYVCDAGLNATRAYRTAFPAVSYNTAKTESCKLLTKPYIQARIEELKQDRYQRLEITPERILSEMAKMAFYDPREYFYDDGRIKPLSEIDPDHASVICSMEVRCKSCGEVVITRIRLPDKRGSLELLGKHFKLFNGTAYGKSVAPILQAVLDGEISVRDAAYQITIMGEPLPEILKIELAKIDPDVSSDSEGVSVDELERRAQEAIQAIELQRKHFLPRRQEEIHQLKTSLKKWESFGSENMFSK